MYKVTQEADSFEIRRTIVHILINLIIGFGLLYYFGRQLWGNIASKDYVWVTLNSLLILFILRGFFIQISKLFKNDLLLRIDKEGVQTELDGFIPKTDITHIQLTDVTNPKQRLFVYVKNPEAYLSQASGLKKVLAVRLYQESGTPIVFRLKGAFDRYKLSKFLADY
jgi:hypothetical protein